MERVGVMMKDKIGVGIITCNRAEFFKKCLQSVPLVDKLVVVNDGAPYPESYYDHNACPVEVIQHKGNKSVGVSKNEALKALMDDGCEHLFLIEDDMYLKNPEVFKVYIRVSKETGIRHLNFAYHGNGNRDKSYKPAPRKLIAYGSGIELALNTNCLGAFSYYHKSVIDAVGYMDEEFVNVWEHVEHTHRIIKLGMHPQFWWFADVKDSCDYIGELDQCHSGSTIRRTPEWKRNLQIGTEHYIRLHGRAPTQTHNEALWNVLASLRKIKDTYG